MHATVSESRNWVARGTAQLWVLCFFFFCRAVVITQEDEKGEQKEEEYLQVWVEVSDVKVSSADTIDVKCYGHPLQVSIQDVPVPKGEREKEEQIETLKGIIEKGRHVVVAYTYKRRKRFQELSNPLKVSARVFCDGKDVTELLEENNIPTSRTRVNARVTDVKDGDTISVEFTDELPVEGVRLADIDTPNKGEYGYEAAADFLKKSLGVKKDSTVRIARPKNRALNLDPYKRVVANVFTNEGRCLAFSLWEKGYYRYNKVRKAGDAVLAFLDTDSALDKFWAVVVLGELRKKRFKDALEELRDGECSQELKNAINLAIENIARSK